MAIRFAAPRHAGFAAVLLAFAMLATARAEDAPQLPPEHPTVARSDQKSGGTGGRASTPASPGAAEQHKLPPDSTTKQTLVLPGRTLAFRATAGSIRLFDGKGEPEADIAYTAYQLDGTDPATRPVTFLFNGGPGAASAYLQLGAAGPWRLAINGDAAIPSASPELKPNAETWLDFTDLVFIDPVGTGYSRFVATGDDVRKRFFSVDGDVNAISLTICAGWKSPAACSRPNLSPARAMAASAARRSFATCRSSRASG
jgi:carboxypeptidase C (cathepsin A)